MSSCRARDRSTASGGQCLVGDPAVRHRQQHPAGQVHPEQRRVLAAGREALRPSPSSAPTRSNTTRSAGAPSTSPTEPFRRDRPPRIAAGPTVSAAIARASVSCPASTAARTRPSAVSMPLIPFAASPNSTALSTSVWGAWSVAIASAVPSARAARQASASAGVAERRVDPERRGVGRGDERVVPPRIAVLAGLPGEAARARDPLVGQGEVVRRHVAGDRQAGGLGPAHELQRGGRGDVGEMQSRARHVAARRRRGSRGRARRRPPPRPPASRAAPGRSRRTRRSPRRHRSASDPRGGPRSAARARPRTRARCAGSTPTGPANRRPRSRRRRRRPARRAPPASRPPAPSSPPRAPAARPATPRPRPPPGSATARLARRGPASCSASRRPS